jgi:hypothetical protein
MELTLNIEKCYFVKICKISKTGITRPKRENLRMQYHTWERI